MENVSVKALIKEINETKTQISASAKDEQRVMRAMLNDPTFKVDIYGKGGVKGQYCPYDDARQMISSIIKDTTHMGTKEAEELASGYEFGKNEATTMINISKEFVNTYVETGRKLPLGGRADSDISIAKKVKEAKANTYPKKVGVNADGTDKYETVTEGTIPAHGSLKVYSPAPSWLIKK
jgi:hypothetical protein